MMKNNSELKETERNFLDKGQEAPWRENTENFIRSTSTVPRTIFLLKKKKGRDSDTHVGSMEHQTAKKLAIFLDAGSIKNSALPKA